ncbi:MAG: NnrS family protein [Gammaproteobacteria bacterium]|nr:NnrS family protein [Gammaproteobacteria bacterium]
MKFWQTFSAAPHRMMFFGGALQLILAMVFWTAELAGRYTGWWSPLPTTIPAAWAHMFLMLFALFTFFVFGFLMTTYPRWMGGPMVPRSSYVTAFLLLSAGTLLYYLGLFTSRWLVVMAVSLLLAGWGTAIHALLRVYRLAPTNDKSYETYLNIALISGWLGGLSYLLWLITETPQLLNLSLRMGLWLYLVPVLVTVGHRMIPYFSSCVLTPYSPFQPRWSLHLFWGLLVLHGVLEFTGAWDLLFLSDLPLTLLALYHSFRWSFRRSFEVRLLAVLHIAFLWLGLGMALFSAQSLTMLVTGSLSLGKAPLHAIMIGFATGMLVAMASRVTLGHSGRPLVADDFTWACFLGIMLTTLLRIGAEIPAINLLLGFHLNLLTAVAWFACLLPWVARYATIYLRPRLDGNAG